MSYGPRQRCSERPSGSIGLATCCTNAGDCPRPPNAWPEAGRVTNLVSFEPDKIDVYLDGKQLHLEPGQTVIPHGVDRGLDTDEVLQKTPTASAEG